MTKFAVQFLKEKGYQERLTDCQKIIDRVNIRFIFTTFFSKVFFYDEKVHYGHCGSALPRRLLD